MVHPHARGEDALLKSFGQNQDGSPPRTWGRRVGSLRELYPFRFTPTHVGKTSQPSRTLTKSMVHPHARGEDCGVTLRSICYTGSPPRTWGRPPERRYVILPKWFTPTHVGKTSCSSTESKLAIGSPPRTWGRHDFLCGQLHVFRFTPTHVGKTNVLASLSMSTPVHPHARGEDDVLVGIHRSLGGSPPRTWGRLSIVLSKNASIWFTPTHVGKTFGDPHSPSA